ncbi:ferredoxin [Dactylosporangium sp. NPDC050688]|uniref:ferredoxin n=1 Tax=Dactylosporangium sp. NPDC050688 TaxID=3157217 RepID=UPI0033D69BA1
MHVTVDEDLCCGAGQCALAAPEVFAQREDRTVMLLQPAPQEQHRDAVLDAVGSCPKGAITLSDAAPVPFADAAGEAPAAPPA